jgi:Mg-chelatase subunit ChlD
MSETASEGLRRWRLVLGGDEADGTCATLDARDSAMDACLAALYDSERRGGLGGSAPNVARWLGDIREYFPSSVVQVMQADAIERLDMKQLLLEPETLATIEPSIQLAATLISMRGLIPAKTRATARLVVRKLCEDVERRLSNPLRQQISGALNRSARNRRPKHAEIDWHRTIRANLRHYQREYRTIIPETRIGFGRKGSALRDIVLCVDQSGSMAGSVVYSSILAATMASIRAVKTHLVVFDTSVVDMTPRLADPVEVLFGVQLGGGTDIAQALAYCQGLIQRPSDTVFVLISDLLEGGDNSKFLARAEQIAKSGATAICLLALDDHGAPCYDRGNAATLAGFGMPTFATTPDLFPELMAAAIKKEDIGRMPKFQLRPEK